MEIAFSQDSREFKEHFRSFGKKPIYFKSKDWQREQGTLLRRMVEYQEQILFPHSIIHSFKIQK
jgi:hypothetical protein